MSNFIPRGKNFDGNRGRPSHSRNQGFQNKSSKYANPDFNDESVGFSRQNPQSGQVTRRRPPRNNQIPLNNSGRDDNNANSRFPEYEDGSGTGFAGRYGNSNRSELSGNHPASYSSNWRAAPNSNRDQQPRSNGDSKRGRGNIRNPDQQGYRRNAEVFSFLQTNNLIKKMLTEEYRDNIALTLLDPKVQIKNFLNNTDNQDLETSRLIIQVILKASQNKLMVINFRDLLVLVLQSNFSKIKLDHLISIDIVRNVDAEDLRLIILFLKLSFEILPTMACDMFYVRFCNISLFMENLKLRSNIISSDIEDEFQELKLLVESTKTTKSPGKKPKGKVILDDGVEPPDDYREISIFPNSSDLNIGTREVFLRRNKDRGVYKSVDDYLDVQFRLMREDFIQPLREGLAHIKNDRGKKRLEIRVYKRVFVVNCLPVDRIGIVYNLSFDLSHLKRVKWTQSKRFIYGSLLCLSKDNFKTLLFATVANRDVRDLEQGLISVKFYDCSPTKDVEYTLVETTNMFESYRHVLLKLQETNADNLCLQKYLVFAEEKISLPGYLVRNNGLGYLFSGQKFCPGLKDHQWPRAVDFELDESQFQAFKTSLTNEITIIQGPPGTGKTYLGLKICQCLLENVQKQIFHFGPILVVCYTNHALDQFLEGISAFTKNIIRIGSRSKSELLQTFSLINWKMKTSSVETVQRKRVVFGKMRDIKEDLLEIQAKIKMSHDTLIGLQCLRMFIPDGIFNELMSIGIKKWLEGESFDEESASHFGIQPVLDNIVEWIVYEEFIEKLYDIIIESQVEILNGDEDEYKDDRDLEVNYLNNQRRLDVDEEDISNLNAEFETVIGKMRAVTFDEDNPAAKDDGFTLVRSKVTKQLFKRRLRSKEKMTAQEADRVVHIDKLSIWNRWRLYHYWRHLYIETLDKRSSGLEMEYETLSKQLNELNFEEDRKVMMEQDVIGMTTTGAARYGRVLAQIQCKIIIVEEAAEVLESHIVGSLNPGCEHLILIGDHKQLKPNPAVYELSKTYQLDLSLFERLINNGLHFNTLELQHRMRPEIATIMNYIYKNLKNHESVLDYPNVPAVSTNIFFFDHTQPESLNDEISSYSNVFEAEFVVGFCRHLMKNGIENGKITILTLYSGQLFLLRSMMPKQTFDGVRVCVVDNYQGEENDIIMLSLVRSNENEKIGFLNIENRICVSLSRAKIGLFVFGNFQILANQNELWKNICHDLRKKQLLGDTLTLLCQNHPEKRLEIQKPEDFNKYPEGGCEQLCNQRLGCGHACRKSCHFLDKNHLQVKCMETCTKLCPNGHRCTLKCWQQCRSCMVEIPKIIPGCNHTQKMACHKDPEPDCCKNECKRVLACGHKCIRPCREKCTDCLTKIMKTSPDCEHEGEFACCDKALVCKKKCTAILDCEHQCAGTCGGCNAGRLHVSCGNKCKNQLICGHLCKSRCSLDCPPCTEKCEEGCIHNACPRKCGDECVPCFEKCRWKCKHKKCTKKCFEECDRQVCDERCEKLPDCNKCNKRFQCYGICGEPCRKVCLRCDPEVKEIFFGTEDNEDSKFITLWTCGHSFECESMDRFMETVPDNEEIVQKRCPRCNTIINKRSCFRYLNIVKRISADIKKVQILITRNEQKTDVLKFMNKLDKSSTKISDIFKIHKVDNYFELITRDQEWLSSYETTKYEKSLDLVASMYNKLHRRFKELQPILDVDRPYIGNAISLLLRWLHPVKRKFNSFEITQFHSELDRIDYILTLTHLRKTQPFYKELPDFIDELKHCQSFSGVFAEKFRDKIKDYDYLPNMAITERERKEIVAAIGLGKGRWFKCPKGHFYVIGECGGANQMAKCMECDAQVGGEHHQIVDGNQFAPEIDGAQYPAFSNLANLANFGNLPDFIL